MTLNSSDLQQVDKAFSTLRIIWVAMLASLVVYVLVANVMDHVLGLMPMVTGPDDPGSAKYGYGLYGIAVAELAVAFYFRKLLLDQKGTQARMNDRIDSFFGSSGETQGIDGVQWGLSLYRNSMVLCLGLSEAVALCGLMGFLVRTDYVQLYVLTGVSLLALAYFRPKRHEILALVEKFDREQQQKRGPNKR